MNKEEFKIEMDTYIDKYFKKFEVQLNDQQDFDEWYFNFLKFMDNFTDG